MKHEPERWKADYHRDGCLVVEDVIDPGTLGVLRGEIEKITADPENLPADLRRHVHLERESNKRQKYNDMPDDQLGNAVRNIMELPTFSQPLAQLIAYEPLLDVLQSLFESTEFHFHNYKCIIKAPKVSSAFHWHRDLPYLQHTTPNLITAMLCIDPMTEDNGATVVLPGSHRIPHEQVTRDDMEIEPDDVPSDVGRKTLVCPAGSAVLFHVNQIHGGGANRSQTPRRNVIGIWAGPDTYPTTAYRYAYHGLAPRSQDPARQRQVQMTFPRLCQSATV